MSIKKSSKLINQSITSINQLIIILSLFYNQPLQPLHFKQSVNPAAVLTGVQGAWPQAPHLWKQKGAPHLREKIEIVKNKGPADFFGPGSRRP